MIKDLWREGLTSTVYDEAARRVHFGLAAEKIKTDHGIFHVVTFSRKDFLELKDWFDIPLRFGIKVVNKASYLMNLDYYLAGIYPEYDLHGFVKDIIVLVKKENKGSFREGENMNEVKIESRDSIRFGDIIIQDDNAYIVNLDHTSRFIVLVNLANGTTRTYSTEGFFIGSQVNIAGILEHVGFKNYRVIRNPEIIIRER